MENLDLNIKGIKTAEEYTKEEQARLKLGITDEAYKDLKESSSLEAKIKNIRPTEEYTKEEQARLKLDITDEAYKDLKHLITAAPTS